MEIDANDNWVPQHPDQPQDTTTFDQSGSTANYLRATSPVADLSMEKILAAMQAGNILDAIQNGDDSSSSKDYGSASLIRITNVTVPSFVIRACQRVPAESLLPLTLKLTVPEWKEDVQKAILPVVPVMGSILIRLWVFLFGEKPVASQSLVGTGPLYPNNGVP